MDWTTLLVSVALVGAYFAFKRMTFVSAEQARKLLKEGALVIDVRSAEEFSSGSVAGAIHVALGELKQKLPERVKDRHQVLLLHCLSGGRSAIARQQLKGMGYTRVYNLGSLNRARTIVESAAARV